MSLVALIPVFVALCRRAMPLITGVWALTRLDRAIRRIKNIDRELEYLLMIRKDRTEVYSQLATWFLLTFMSAFLALLVADYAGFEILRESTRASMTSLSKGAIWFLSLMFLFLAVLAACLTKVKLISLYISTNKIDREISYFGDMKRILNRHFASVDNSPRHSQ